MSARLFCVSAALIGGVVGACLPTGSESETVEARSQDEAAKAPDAPLEIAINQFPSGYQGRWASTTAGCADDPENSEQMMSLQGKLVKFHESIGTMTAGKRMTSRAMEAEFEFVGEGEKWNKRMAFEMSEDRKSLTRTDKDSGASYRYVQCPKLMAG
ncbi:MAG: hypothetical protein IBJ12_05000 [Sphingomonadaceae bacterium]|nr:hypothetical protein [Sphingomonadaceae bacterium]